MRRLSMFRRRRWRWRVPADMHLASCARTGIAAGVGVAVIRPGAGAGWPALQRQHVGGEIEEVRDKKACLSTSS